MSIAPGSILKNAQKREELTKWCYGVIADFRLGITLEQGIVLIQQNFPRSKKDREGVIVLKQTLGDS